MDGEYSSIPRAKTSIMKHTRNFLFCLYTIYGDIKRSISLVYYSPSPITQKKKKCNDVKELYRAVGARFSWPEIPYTNIVKQALSKSYIDDDRKKDKENKRE